MKLPFQQEFGLVLVTLLPLLAFAQKIAVIGGGVEGLSAAYFSARLGHDPVVFEATSLLGGILRKAISRERLSMGILDWDIQGIIELGVEIKTNTCAGKDFTINTLLSDGYEAVFTATGGWDSRVARGGIDHPENIIPNTYLLIDLLRSGKNEQPIACGSNVVLAGGDSKITDAVKVLKEKGVTNITLVSRKEKEESNFDDSILKELGEQQVSVIFNAGITKLLGQENNLTQVEAVSLKTGETKRKPRQRPTRLPLRRPWIKREQIP